ncbi:MAG: CvpA family protein, partial [Phycisphaerae bacterium]|nr:CvpA family protein [Phycisphaerae bacterium]
ATGNSYGQAVALVLVFAVSLLCLRAIADNVVLGDVTFSWQIERVGGGILGFVAGMIIAGVVLIGWQLMPFGPGLLASGYQDFHGLTALAKKQPADRRRRGRGRQHMKLDVSSAAKQSWASYNRYDEQMKLQAAPFPYVDSFTLRLVKALSNGSMSGEQSFGGVHQDLLLEAWGNRNGVNFLSRQAAPGKAILSAEWQPIQEQSPEADGDNRLRGVLSLTLSVEAKDKDGVVRFKGPQVRLVGKSGRSYWPMGIHLDNMPWSKLYGELNGLADERGYLQYGKADYRLWGRDEEEEGVIRREIRGHETDRLWWQVQLLGGSGELRLLPASLGVVQKPQRVEKTKEKAVTIELIFDIAEGDVPDYVVFKRTAMAIIEREEEPSVQAEKRQEDESAGEGPEDKPIPKIE